MERGFSGTCRDCGKDGHRAADCPDKPEAVCQVCGQEGHKGTECEMNRIFAEFKVKDLDSEVAWEKIEIADKEKDIHDIKEVCS